MSHFSFPSLIAKALGANKGWSEQWAKPAPKAEYDVIIVGAGGHGLAAAYYLAKEHNITNVAVLEKDWLCWVKSGHRRRSSTRPMPRIALRAASSRVDGFVTTSRGATNPAHQGHLKGEISSPLYCAPPGG